MRGIDWRKILLCLSAFVSLLAFPLPVKADAERSPLVAAAASLRFVMPELVSAFRQELGQKPKIIFGASGALRRQIENGAPFEIFFSADEGHALALSNAGLTEDEGVVYGVGRLAIFVPVGSSLLATGDLSGLEASLEEGRLSRLSIANPRHAPYGKSAVEVLKRRGLYSRLSDRLVIAENVAQAAQFAASGGADGGLISQSLALSPALKDRGRSDLVPASLHAPIRQRAVILPEASTSSRAFLTFVLSDNGRRILRRHGIASPQAKKCGTAAD